MSELSNKAEEIAGRAKQTAGDLTGNDELHAEGVADEARAQFTQGVDAVVEKAQDTADAVSEAVGGAADTARQFHLDDSRVQIALAAGLALAIALVVRRTRSKSRSTKRSIARGAAAAGLANAFSR